MSYLKLNLGCGNNKYDGFLNVDKFGEPDIKWDLEKFPWPWEDNSVDEIRIIHVLEHLGKDTETYFNIFKEIYRISVDKALLYIVVPHFRHDFFFNDPTHIRVVTPESLQLFSKSFNYQCEKKQFSNSPLGLYLNIDIELIGTKIKPGEAWFKMYPNKEVNVSLLLEKSKIYNNLIEEFQMKLRIKK